MHSEGILAGELKHGPLALVDKLMPVIMIIMRDHTYTKCQNALQQVVARQVRPEHFFFFFLQSAPHCKVALQTVSISLVRAVGPD